VTTPLDSSSTTTSITINADICNINGQYDGNYGISHWKPVSVGNVSEGKCNYGKGSAKWMCLQNGLFDQNGPDFSECTLDSVITAVDNITDVSEVIQIVGDLVENTGSENSFTNGQELKGVIDSIKKLQKYVESKNEEIDFNKALNLTNNFIHIFSNLISKKTRGIM